ncbi:MAG: hypothetical protein PVJ02_05585, partial [Gemmatimonadota bacterium]
MTRPSVRPVALSALLSLLVLIVTVTPVAAGLPPTPDDSTAYDRWYAGLRRAEPDEDRGSDVSGLTLVRDRGTFHFDSGRMHLLEPIDGHTYGAVFIGDGRFTLTPPTPVEQASLKRLLEVDSVDMRFRTAVLFFTDVTEGEMAQAL